MDKKRLLLINPWIADFTAYDLWAKPLGLLVLAGYLSDYGYEIEWLDLTDRSRFGSIQDNRNKDGRGKYQKTIIPKPPPLAHIPRQYGLYGATPEQFRQCLSELVSVDAILMTSHMTYWYPGVAKTAGVLREFFPQTPLILGGIYATLMPDHANTAIRPDYLVTGYGEKKTLMLLDELFGLTRDYTKVPEYHTGGFLPWHLYSRLESVALMTSRGCPNRCTYCASGILNPKFMQRPAEEVVREIKEYTVARNVHHFAFFDDALFFRSERHIKPILRELLQDGAERHFHTPNGLFAGAIDPELAQLMFASHFDTIRLSLESVTEKWQQASSAKVSNRGFREAIHNLLQAGYQASDLETYLLIGLPGQTPDEVREAIRFVADCGAIVRLASFTPIPGTPEWKRAVELGMIDEMTDPLLTNKSIFASSHEDFPASEYTELKQLANELNQQNRENKLNGDN